MRLFLGDYTLMIMRVSTSTTIAGQIRKLSKYRGHHIHPPWKITANISHQLWNVEVDVSRTPDDPETVKCTTLWEALKRWDILFMWCPSTLYNMLQDVIATLHRLPTSNDFISRWCRSPIMTFVRPPMNRNLTPHSPHSRGLPTNMRYTVKHLRC